MDEAPICPVTGEPMVRDTRPFVISYKGRKQDVALPGWYCDASGESIHSREDLKVSDRALMTLKAEVDGLATPSEVARVRKNARPFASESKRNPGWRAAVIPEI
jgi:HTH-type transcriptional regulator / antitoxin MqsA